jgi:hypothetical protein
MAEAAKATAKAETKSASLDFMPVPRVNHVAGELPEPAVKAVL